MSDLPDRLRAEAAALARFSRKLSLTGNHTEGGLLGEQAGLMRDAADEVERLKAERSAAHDALNDLRSYVQSVIGHAPPEATDDDQVGWLDAGLCETDARLCHVVATLLKPSPASSPIVKGEES